MKGDFTRNTFDPAKHYQQVLMQQGRAQLDADWNEQAAIAARRDATTARDLIGGCGGPADDAAFGVVTAVAQLPAGPQTDWFNQLTTAEQQAITAALAGPDFLLTAGRYYVDGLQCELEHPVLFSAQPDRLASDPLTAGQTYLLYLDVWRRHLTALEDGAIREPALGGPDTGTRVKTVWQVRAAAYQPADSTNPCAIGAADFASLIGADPGTARLTADTDQARTSPDPCEVPESAGYKGLENQLYRVEIHQGSRAANGTAQKATWKWSRENGSVLAPLTRIAGDTLTLTSLGPDDHLGFRKDDWVEILDDACELEDRPGQLRKVIDFSPEQRTLQLQSAVTALATGAQFPNDVDPSRHPKVRRWEGTDDVVANKWLPLESGVQVRFDNAGADYRTGQYWQIPARAATATAVAGDIEWPCDLDTDGSPDPRKPQSLPPRGIEHHYCRLGVIAVAAGGVTAQADCRCLWPSLAAVPRLFYVSGDGQAVMPVAGEPLAALPRPLQVQVGVSRCSAGAGATVRFILTDSVRGRLSVPGSATSDSSPVTQLDVSPNAEGVAECAWALDANQWEDPALWTQQVEARLLDSLGMPLAPPVRFNASLSVANQVLYKHGGWWGPLEGFYFNGTNLEGTTQQPPLLKRFDKQINFDWGSGSPASAVPADQFSVRWTGLLRPQYTEDYTFYTLTDDGLRLWVDGNLVIDHWSDQSATERVSNTIRLTADQKYTVKMEYYENTGLAVAKLSWSSPSTPKAIIPPDGFTVHLALTDLYGNYALFYVSGDGQEVMPLPGQSSAPLAYPLQVRAANGRWPAPGATVRFVLRDGAKGNLKSGSQVSTTTGSGEIRLDLDTDLDGAAECAWALDPDPTKPTQQAEAWLLDPDGNPVAEPIRFNANLSTASQVAYDPQNCPDLKRAGATTVQQAIDGLCQRTGGCEKAVATDEPLDEVVMSLLGQKQWDIRLCLEPGDHTLPNGWNFDFGTVEGKVNLVITGGGRATRLAIAGKPVVLRHLNSFVLRDVDITQGNDLTLALLQGPEVEVSGCGFAGRTVERSLLLVGGAERLSVQRNVMEAYGKNADQMPGRVFTAAFWSALAGASNRNEVALAAQNIANDLAKRPPAELQRFANAAGTRMKGASVDMTPAEADSYTGFLTDLSAKSPDPQVLADDLVAIWVAAARAAPGWALVIEGAAADVTITDNDILGITSLFGNPTGTPLTDAEWKQLGASVKEGLIRTAGANGTLQVHTNRLSRITLGEAMIQSLSAAVQPKPAPLTGIHAEAFFSRNVIELGDNLMLARVAALTTNRFNETGGDLGRVIADSSVYVGNSAPNELRLFNYFRATQKAANLLINIQDV
jgi:hypothetical protein